MSFTIDGLQKLFLCDLGTIEINVKDLYSIWKRWLLESDNAKYPHAFEVVGGDPTIGNNIITPYFFLANGWKIRPQEANHNLNVDGILLVKGGGDVFVDTLGIYRVAINAIVPIYTETVLVGGGGVSNINKQDIRDAMLLKPTNQLTPAIGSLDNAINRIDKNTQT